jgi:hypothetical protein
MLEQKYGFTDVDNMSLTYFLFCYTYDYLWMLGGIGCLVYGWTWLVNVTVDQWHTISLNLTVNEFINAQRYEHMWRKDLISGDRRFFNMFSKGGRIANWEGACKTTSVAYDSSSYCTTKHLICARRGRTAPGRVKYESNYRLLLKNV